MLILKGSVYICDICICMSCEYMHVPWHLCGQRKTLSGSPWFPSYLIHGLSAICYCTVCSRLAGLQASRRSHSISLWEITCSFPHNQFMGSRDLNSDSQACQANALTTEPILLPSVCLFCFWLKMWFYFWDSISLSHSGLPGICNLSVLRLGYFPLNYWPKASEDPK